MLIEVTQKDINKGKKTNCAKCPVARAAQRKQMPEYHFEATSCSLKVYRASEVSRNSGRPREGSFHINEFFLPDFVQDWILAYDGDNMVKPFSFELLIDQYCSNTLFYQ